MPQVAPWVIGKDICSIRNWVIGNNNASNRTMGNRGLTFVRLIFGSVAVVVERIGDYARNESRRFITAEISADSIDFCTCDG